MRGGRVDKEEQPPLHLPTQESPQQIQDHHFAGNNNKILSRPMKNIVLVHGGFVDGAGWESVYRVLKQDGYDVSIVQNPTISLNGDVAY